MALSSPGIGSNLDVNGIVKQLMTLESQPLTALDKKEGSYQAKLSAYGNIKGALSAFQASARSLSSLSKFQSVVKATVADSTLLTASTLSNAVPGNYNVNTTQLAQAQTVMTAGKVSTTDVIGNGTLTFQFGTISGGSFNSGTGQYTGATYTQDAAQASKSVTIDSTNNSLQGIRDAINAAGVGVTATLVNDGTAAPNRIVLTSNSTGAVSSMKIAVTGDVALQNLLGYDPAGTQNLSQTNAAQNAALTVNGVAISSATNTVSGAIQGTTLNLLKSGSTTLTVTRDTDATQASVQSFVDAYNSINKTLSDISAYDANTKQAAVLQGDFTIQTIQSQIRSTLNSTITGLSNGYTLLSQIGVSFQKNGTLALDTAKLKSAMSSSSSEIAGLFAATGKPSDTLVNYSNASSKTQPGSYAINVTTLATKGASVGSATAGTTITLGVNDTLNLTVDGVSASVTLSAGSYSAASLATMVQSAINGVTAFSSAGISVAVTQSGGVMTITSNRYGSASNVNVGGNGASNLMGTTPTITAGVDVAGTINNRMATGSGQFLTGEVGDASEGIKVEITGGTTGARGTINYAQGYAYQLDKLVDRFIVAAGGISSRTDGLNNSIKDINDRREVLSRRLVDIEKRYRAQFTALDAMLGKMNQTSNYLAQQLSNLPK